MRLAALLIVPILVLPAIQTSAAPQRTKTSGTAKAAARRKPANAAARKIVPALIGTWTGSQPAEHETVKMTVRLQKDGRYLATLQGAQRRSTDQGAWWGDGQRVHRRSSTSSRQDVVSYTYRLQGWSLVLTSRDGTRLRLSKQGG